MSRFKDHAALVLALGVGAVTFACESDPPLDVAEVDLSRFQGKWHEVARLPRPTQADCEGTTAFYRLRSPREMDVTNECRRSGSLRSVAARAIVTDESTPAKLSLDVGGFYGDYWILEVGSTYEYAVVGHPTRDYLWILSRTPALPGAVLDGILERTALKHFDVERLEYTVQP